VNYHAPFSDSKSCPLLVRNCFVSPKLFGILARLNLSICPIWKPSNFSLINLDFHSNVSLSFSIFESSAKPSELEELFRVGLNFLKIPVINSNAWHWANFPVRVKFFLNLTEKVEVGLASFRLSPLESENQIFRKDNFNLISNEEWSITFCSESFPTALDSLHELHQLQMEERTPAYGRVLM